MVLPQVPRKEAHDITKDELTNLATVVAKAGLPALSGALLGPAGAAIATAVTGALAETFGTPKTPTEVIQKASEDPQATSVALKQLENLQIATQAAADLARTESTAEHWFSWAWRPAMSWLLIVLWSWALLLLPTLKASVFPGLLPIPMDNLLSFTGIWLTIYGGGHTLKAVLSK